MTVLGKYLNVVCHSSVGGTNIREDMAKAKEGVHVIIGTLGRVNDLIERKAIKTENIKHLCFDGAYELLSHSFKVQIKKCGYRQRSFSAYHR